MRKENNRMVSMRSNAQQCTVILYHMGRKNNRMASMHSRAQPYTVITCKLGLRQPIRIIDEVVP